MSWAESAGPDASPTCRTGPQDSYATTIVGSVGLIQTLTARSTQSTRSPPLTSPYNAPTTLPNPGRLFALPTSGVRRKRHYDLKGKQ